MFYHPADSARVLTYGFDYCTVRSERQIYTVKLLKKSRI